MPNLRKADVFELARAAGLEVDDSRAETISPRLSGVLTELDDIPTEKLMSVEPSQIFSVKKESDNA
jgi:hypothetical protein